MRVGLGWALELRNGPRSRVPQREHESSGEESHWLDLLKDTLRDQ